MYALDGQVHACQVKTARYLRHRLGDSSKSLWAGPLAAPVSSWHAGRRAARELPAGDVMTPLGALTTLAPGTTVHQAIGEMLQADADALLVCDGEQVAGVVTLADLARCIHNSRGALSIERVGTLMRPPAAVGMAAPLPTVRALMAEEGTGLVAVTGPGGLTVGCVTAQSLLAREPGGRDTARPREASTLVPLLGTDTGTVKVCVPV
jgi:CBS domain-containing protein